MKKKLTQLLLGVLAAIVIIAVAAFPSQAMAADTSNPYEITIDGDATATVSTVEEDSPLLDKLSEGAKNRAVGIEDDPQVIMGLKFPVWGKVLSPFSLTSQESSLTITMKLPELIGYGEELVEGGTPENYRILVTASGDKMPVYVVGVKLNEKDDTLTATIPMIADTVTCGVVQRSMDSAFENNIENDSFTQTDPILENAYGSAVLYSWTFEMPESVFENNYMYNYYNDYVVSFSVFLGDAELDESATVLTSDVWDLGEITDCGGGNYVITLVPPEDVDQGDQIDEEDFKKPITLSIRSVLPKDKFDKEGTLSAYIDFAFRQLYNKDVDNVQNCLSASSGVMTAQMEPAVTVKPADMTIYEGGQGGYEDVVDPDSSNVQDGSLPEPLFYIVPSEETSTVEPTELVFTKGAESSTTKKWTVAEAGKDADGNTLYKFVAADNTQDVRVTYTDAEGNAVLSDQFDPSDVGDLCTTYLIDIYPGDKEGDDEEKVQAQTDDGPQYPVSLSSGTLTVRAVDAEDETSVTHKAVTSLNDKVGAGKGAVVVGADTTYTLNDTKVTIPDSEGISLLFDGIIDDPNDDGTEGSNRTDALIAKVDEKLGAVEPGFNRNYQAQFLDLVDVNNGNAWVKADDDVTVYWGYPEGTGQSTEFTLYHFKGLHRQGENSGFDLDDLDAAEIEVKVINKDAKGISFIVEPGGFSPYVLTWDVDARHTITATAGAGGTITPTGDVKVTDGADQTFTITANSGYEVASVKVDGQDVTLADDGTYTFTKVDGNRTINVTFRSTGGTVTPPTTRYTIDASAGEGGSISPSGKVTVSAGQDKTFTITPDEDNKIMNVTIDGTAYGPLASYTFEDVRANHTISVTFAPGNAPADPGETGVDQWFDVTNHGAFLNGYGDGSGLFGPNNQMTRAEAAQMFYNMLKDKSHGDIDVMFPDVEEDAWYYEPVMVLASHGIIQGHADGTFKPAEPIARAEFTAMAMRFSNGSVEGENIFDDVDEGAWYYDYVVGAVKYGWINGYQDGEGHRFEPSGTLARCEATAIANRMLGRVADGVWINAHLEDRGLKLFPDVTPEHWAFFDVVEATNAHDYQKDGGFEHWTGLKDE